MSDQRLPACLVLAMGLILSSSSAVAQCNDGLFLDGFEDPADYDWPVAVEVSQLGSDDPGRSVTFTLNGASPMAITADGTYCFDATTPGEQTWTIQIAEQPTEGDACSVEPATGTAVGPVLVQASCDSTSTRWDEFDWDGADWN